jgi:hypothetical protein
MSAEAALAVLGEVVTVLTPVAGMNWWAFKLGQASGRKQVERAAAQAEDKARIESLERQLSETQKQLDAIQQSQGTGQHP